MSQLREIRSVTPTQDDCLEVIWTDGSRPSVDFILGVSGDGILAPLLDPTLFRAVRMGDRARTIEWHIPIEAADRALIDIDADALFKMSETKTSVAIAASTSQTARDL